MDIESTKNIALTSREMKILAYEKLWSRPKFKGFRKSSDFLKGLLHLPIRELYSDRFECSWVEVMKIAAPHIKLLHIDFECSRNRQIPNDLHNLPKIPVVIHSNVFNEEREHFERFFNLLESMMVKEVVIDHGEYSFTTWPVKLLKLVAEKYHISRLYTNSLDLSEENFVDFIDILANCNDCRVYLTGEEALNYCFTVENLEYMVERDIKIVEIESCYLDTNEEISALFKFADVMRKMRHLEVFNFTWNEFECENSPPMELLTDLPFESLFSYNFNMQEGQIDNAAWILSNIKSMKARDAEFQLRPDFVTFYKITPEEFALFQNLPVTLVELWALDLTESNVVEFREIMEKMKIEHIEFDKGDFDFEISIKKFGPADRYKTI